MSQDKKRRSGSGLLAGLAVVIGTALYTATPARAGGLHDEIGHHLGQIAAHHAAIFGSVLFHAVAPPVHVVHSRPHRHYRGCGHHGYRDKHYRDGPRHRGKRHGYAPQRGHRHGHWRSIPRHERRHIVRHHRRRH